jgi:hypothetical protein
MRKCVVVLAALLITALVPSVLFAQHNFFAQAREGQLSLVNDERVIKPAKYAAHSIDVAGMRDFLSTLPSEQNTRVRNLAPIIELPMPDGSFAKFRVWQTMIMESSLAAKYPDIKTFSGRGIDNPAATLKMDYNPYFGFSAQILSPAGNVYIDPYA